MRENLLKFNFFSLTQKQAGMYASIINKRQFLMQTTKGHERFIHALAACRVREGEKTRFNQEKSKYDLPLFSQMSVCERAL
jgi:hypothetical protein